MEQFEVDGNLASEAIKETLAAMFPALSAFEWNIFISEEKPEGYDSNNPAHIFYATQFIVGRLEFQWRASFFMNLGDDTEAREMAIARELSARFNVRTMVGFAHPNFPGDPYYCLVFIGGESFLAEDCEFDYHGEGDSKVTIKILEPYQLPTTQFDAIGKLVTIA